MTPSHRGHSCYFQGQEERRSPRVEPQAVVGPDVAGHGRLRSVDIVLAALVPMKTASNDNDKRFFG